MVLHHNTPPPMEPVSPSDNNIRKRVCKACDRCRLKKSKCDGCAPCSRCKADNAICIFGERKKSHDKVYPKGYVEMLESQQAQLVMGLQELYKRTQSGLGWLGSPLVETTHGAPLTHDILERLGALKQDGQASGEMFEEDPAMMQQRLISSGAGFAQREHSSDDDSDAAHSPTFDQMPQKPLQFTDPFSLNGFPPTPPNQSPYPQNARTNSLRQQSYPQPSITPVDMNANLLQRHTWAQPPTGFDDAMDFMADFDPTAGFDPMAAMYGTMPAPMGTIDPCQSMRYLDEDFINPRLL